LKVRRPDGEKLGQVDGFIIDRDAQRAYYVVVDSGGWFSSRQFLVPIGHARMDGDGDALVLDVTRESISRYPEFDRDSFERFNDDELSAYQARFGDACCEDMPDPHDHFAQPGWWRSEYYSWDVPAAVGTTGIAAASGERRPGVGDRDDDDREVVGTRGLEGGDISPHVGGRAQPGDVLGLETGGERTGLGDTDEEENERRRSAERIGGKNIRDHE
jgi:hypothetical protein